MALRRLAFLVLSFSLCSLAAAPARGHVDELSQVLRPDPLVRSFEADALPALGSVKTTDDPAASEGKTTLVSDIGSGFKLQLGKLTVGMHALYVVANITQEGATFTSLKNPRLAGSNVQTLPLFFELTVNSGPGGAAELHRLRVPVATEGKYQYVARIYFHTPEERDYQGQIVIGRDSRIKSVLIDRVEVRNPLGELTFAPVKTKQMLFTRQDIAGLRLSAVREGHLPEPLRPRPLSDPERLERDRIIWNESVMPLNANAADASGDIGQGNEHLSAIMAKKEKDLGKPLGRWEVVGKAYDQPWVLENKALSLTYTMADYNAGKTLPSPWPIAEDKGGAFFDKDEWGIPVSFNYGFVPVAMSHRYRTVLDALRENGLAQRYLLLGDSNAAEDAAFLLAAYAYRYPGYDWNGLAMENVYQVFRTFEASNNNGRGCSYQGWSTPEIVEVIRSYDKLFPYIQDNSQLAARVGRFVPWVKSPQDVIKLIDTFLVQRAAQDSLQHILYNQALPVAASVLGPGPVADSYLNHYFNKGLYLRNTIVRFADSVTNAYSRDGVNYIGSTFYAFGESVGELMEISQILQPYARGGGNRQYSLDPARFPRLAAMADGLLGCYTAGGQRIGVGDVHDPQYVYNPYIVLQPKDNAAFFLDSFRWTKDSRLAWILANLGGQGAAADSEWAQIVAAAASTRDPLLHIPSHVTEGFGVATLEEGVEATDNRLKQSLAMRFGVGSGHAHADTLDIELYALGMRMSSDLGGRSSSKYGKPNCMSTRVHNLVEVDDISFNGGPQNATATGYVTAFKPNPLAQYVAGSASAETHPQVRQYQRGALQVIADPGDGKTTPPRGYVFDVFRVAGGAVHTWNFHGCVSEDLTGNVKLAPAQSALAAEYLARHQSGTHLEGQAPELLEMTWKLRRREGEVQGVKLKNSEQLMLGKNYDPKAPDQFTRAMLFGHGGEQVLVGNWYSVDARQHSFPLLHVRRTGKDLESVYPALYEPYAGSPIVQGARQLTVTPQSADVHQPVALEVKTALGQTDLLFAGDDATAVYQVAANVQASGQAALISRDKDGLRLLTLVGGSVLADGQVTVKISRPAYNAAIAAVDYAKQTASLTGDDLPAKLLDGQTFIIGNEQHRDCYQVSTAQGHRIQLLRNAYAFQGGVSYLDPAGGFAVLDTKPDLADYHPNYYNGMTLVNEAGQALGKAQVSLGERYWYTGWPEARKHLGKINPGDISDANGDGKTLLTMFAAGGDPARKFAEDGKALITIERGQKMLDLEVTRVRDDGFMFFTKQHPRDYLDALKLPHPGWPYNQQTVRNEAGNKEWVVMMPGDLYQVSLERKLVDADLPDSNNDGRRMIYLCSYGAGDQVSIPTSVHLQRLSPGIYQLRADSPCTISLPGSAIEISPDGAAWKPLASAQADQGKITASFDAASLAAGPLWLKVR